jgi:hypothetical protein
VRREDRVCLFAEFERIGEVAVDSWLAFEHVERRAGNPFGFEGRVILLYHKSPVLAVFTL